MLILIGGSLLLCYFALHDVQMAQGAGLYLSIQFQGNRSTYDFLVELAGMLLLFVAILIPCLAFKRVRPDSIFRFLSVYLALIPMVYPATLVHLTNTLKDLQFRDFGAVPNPATEVLAGIADTLFLFRMVIPFLVILLAINHAHAPAKLQKWQVVVLIAETFFILLYFLLPGLAEETAYFMNYFLLIWCFYEWEIICEQNPRFALWGNILFGGCLLRGIYRIIDLMSNSHL